MNRARAQISSPTSSAARRFFFVFFGDRMVPRPLQDYLVNYKQWQALVSKEFVILSAAKNLGFSNA
jgi:hypothetical protein